MLLMVAISFVQTGSPYLNTVPYGMEKVVMYYKRRYNNTPMYITENGMASTHLFIFLDGINIVLSEIVF